MGHSDAFLDSRWLAERILDWMFEKDRPTETNYFSFVRTREEIALLVGPVGGQSDSDRNLALTFMTRQRNRSSYPVVSDPNSLLREMLHRDRVLLVLPQKNREKLQSAQTLRRVTKQLLPIARDLKESEPCPAPVGYLPLIVDRGTPPEDLTLQLVVTLSQWGLISITEEDRREFVRYLSQIFRRPQRFVPAAEEALSYIFSNWVFPEHWQGFRSYARPAVWACFVQGGRVMTNSTEVLSQGGFRPSEDWAEEQEERSKRGKHSRGPSREHISVFELERATGISRQRLYEAIKSKKLVAVKIGTSLRIETTVAKEFLLRSKQRREIQTFRSRLLDLGITSDAVRKRIYRLRKAGVTDSRIAELLEKMISQPPARVAAKHKHPRIAWSRCRPGAKIP